MDICLPLNITKLHCSYMEACARYSVRAPKHYMLTHHQKCDVGEMQDFFINAAMSAKIGDTGKLENLEAN